jgi:hypothetical protein
VGLKPGQTQLIDIRLQNIPNIPEHPEYSRALLLLTFDRYFSPRLTRVKRLRARRADVIIKKLD